MKHKYNIPRLLPFFSMLFITLDLMSYLYVYEIVNIQRAIFSISVLFFTSTYIINDIIVEVYGYRFARRIIWYALVCEGIFTIFVYLTGNLHKVVFISNIGVASILSKDIFKIFLVSVVTTPIGDFINSILISKCKIFFSGRFFIFRAVFSSISGVIVYSILAQTMLFYGVITLHQLISLIVTSILLKAIFIAVFAIPSSIIVFLLKSFGEELTEDIGFNYNPFSLA